MGLVSIAGYEPAWLSWSTMDGYRMCSKKFELTKVLQLEQRPGLAATGGSAVHKAIEKLSLAEFFDEPLLDIRSTGVDS